MNTSLPIPEHPPRVSIIRSVIFFVIYHLGGVVGVLFIYLNSKLRTQEKGLHGRMFGVYMLNIFLKYITNISYRVEDPDNLLSTHAIFAFNHQSNWEDIMHMHFVNSYTSFITKREVLNIPLFGKCVPYYGGLLIDRKGSKENLEQILSSTKKDVLKKKNSLFICPEGTRKKPGAPYKSKSGIFFFYKNLGIPVVPVAHNSGLFWGKPFWMAKGTVCVKIGPIIPPGLSKQEFFHQLDTTLSNHSQELLPPSLRQTSPQ